MRMLAELEALARLATDNGRVRRSLFTLLVNKFILLKKQSANHDAVALFTQLD